MLPEMIQGQQVQLHRVMQKNSKDAIGAVNNLEELLSWIELWIECEDT